MDIDSCRIDEKSNKKWKKVIIYIVREVMVKNKDGDIDVEASKKLDERSKY